MVYYDALRLPCANRYAHQSATARISDSDLSDWGVGLIIGNTLGGRSSDKNLGKASMFLGLAAMIASLVVVGLCNRQQTFCCSRIYLWYCIICECLAMQLRVMKPRWRRAQELQQQRIFQRLT